MTIKITKLKLRNYRGIAALDVDVGEHGLIARGRNGAGKTTVLRALGAALAASDIGPDAVRLGEEEGEILVDLDRSGAALHVRRRFGAAGSTLQVSNDEGDKKAKPTQVLAELLGTSALDVVSVVLERDKKKRRDLILAALPVAVTVEQLRAWVPSLPVTYDVAGHGLEVVGRLRAAAYEKRTAANKVEADAAAALKQLEAAREACGPVPTGAPALDQAEAARETAERELAALYARRDEAARTSARLDSIRAQARELRQRAAAAVEELPEVVSEHEVTRLTLTRDDARTEIASLEESLVAAKKRLGDVSLVLGEALAGRERLAKAQEAARLADQRASELEAGVEAAVEVVREEDLTAAGARVEAAAGQLAAAKLLAASQAADAAALRAREHHEATKAEAARLDAVVRSLTVDAPAAILAASGVPAGLEIDGNEIRLNGVDLDKLCGKEQVVFAAEIARALNPGAGFLVVDGLERLDPEQLDAFVEAVTAGGRQLIGSLVARGDLELVAIERGEVG